MKKLLLVLVVLLLASCSTVPAPQPAVQPPVVIKMYPPKKPQPVMEAAKPYRFMLIEGVITIDDEGLQNLHENILALQRYAEKLKALVEYYEAFTE